MHDHLGVRTGPKAVTLRLQLGDQGVEVVDLTVEGDPDRPVLVRERLLAGREVDDREPPVAEPHVAAAAFDAGAYRHGIAGPLPAARLGAVQKISFAVRTSVNEGASHAHQDIRIQLVAAAMEHARDPTHVCLSPPPRSARAVMAGLTAVLLAMLRFSSVILLDLGPGSSTPRR